MTTAIQRDPKPTEELNHGCATPVAAIASNPSTFFAVFSWSSWHLIMHATISQVRRSIQPILSIPGLHSSSLAG